MSASKKYIEIKAYLAIREKSSHATQFQNRKINIEVMKVIVIMAGTTISVSKEFHDWLKSKGRKGESYEAVIKRLLKPEVMSELGSSEQKYPGSSADDLS